MKPEWKTILAGHGAEFDHDSVTSFGNPERELRIVTTGAVLADLSHTGLLAVHGVDAQTFLQGQLTSDVREITATRGQLSGYCSPKGRILANFLIFERADTYYLRLPRQQVEPALKRLRMFVLMSKVTIEDASDRWVRFGFAGPQAAEQLRERVGAVPLGADDVLSVNGVTMVRLRGEQARFEIYGELEPMHKLWSALDVHAAPVGMVPWSLLDVRAGIPIIVAQTTDAFVPQMINMQLFGGVSFKKGCYTGQEVVARMQYLGKLKRRMYRGRVHAPECPEAGETLFSDTSASGQGAGKIVNAAPSPDGGYELLAVVEIGSREAGTIHLGSPDGPALELSDPPYPFADPTLTDKA